MQRYQFVAVTFASHMTYAHHAEVCKKKSRILAQRMVEHAKTCARCIAENRLTEEDFYGVYK
jgi:hypothetical protein